jgi:hypothetical protein
VRFLALSLEPDEQLTRVAAEGYGLQMLVAVADGEVLAPLRVNQVPSTLFVDREGIIVAAASGSRKRRFFEQRAAALVRP